MADDDIIAGPATRLFYTPAQLAALRRHAGVPIFFLSHDDVRRLREPPNVEESIAEIRSWLPPSLRHDDQVLRNILSAMRRDVASLIPVYSGENYVGGIAVVPSSSTHPNRIRYAAQLYFGQGVVSEAMAREWALAVAAHEASHAALYARGANSETGAEFGALTFIARHPDLFPELHRTRRVQDFIMGQRALFSLLHDPTNYGHTEIPFFSAETWNDGQRQELQTEATYARVRFMQTLAADLRRQGLLPDLPRREALEHIISGVFLPQRHVTSSAQFTAAANQINLDADTTGLLRRHLRSLGIQDERSPEARRALETFRDRARDFYAHHLLTPPRAPGEEATWRAATNFFRTHGISIDDLEAFVNEGQRIGAASNLAWHLRHQIGQTPVCGDMEASCPDPVGRLANPRSPFLQDTLRTIRELHQRSVFHSDPLQRTFAENILRGASFFMPRTTVPSPSPQDSTTSTPLLRLNP